ncbi:LacI family DNA-binding transcriptional regulator [Actinoplanes sp. NPDC049265]|uniref:LacI family DNA-binding transcriptional regulator n=1 Tax=Actinoplanes sp. NPDC049265 TaxID=3363902 RepID=UPI003724B70B
MAGGRRGRVTLRDVAERAGVSVTTASFVLSGRHDMRISAATEERVLQAARMLDYRKRLVPGTAVPTGAPAIGLISDVVATEAFGGEMIRGCISAATERGHVVFLTDSEGVDELEESAVRALLARGVDRFVYATLGTIEYRVPEALAGQRLVQMNNVDPGGGVPAVLPDDHRAGREAAEALVAAGHTDGIWLVGEVSARSYAAGKRLAGIRAGLRAHGLRLAGHVRCGWWPGESRAALASLLAEGWRERERPTAVIAMNDRAAMGVYQAVAAAGVRVPDDLSVISFDNSDVARWLDPGLSSLALPYFDIGRRAVELLLDDAAEPRVHKLAMNLRSRGSVTAPSRIPSAGPGRFPGRR